LQIISAAALQLQRSGCPECNQEAIRLINLMPKWIPGGINGKIAKSFMQIPEKFKIQ